MYILYMWIKILYKVDDSDLLDEVTAKMAVSNLKRSFAKQQTSKTDKQSKLFLYIRWFFLLRKNQYFILKKNQKIKSTLWHGPDADHDAEDKKNRGQMRHFREGIEWEGKHAIIKTNSRFISRMCYVLS